MGDAMADGDATWQYDDATWQSDRAKQWRNSARGSSGPPDDEEEEVKDAALMIHVEKCLARLRKSLSPATIANNMYATALDFLAAQLAAAANTKTDEVHSIVPMNQEEWRILRAKWLQQTMLILGLKPPNPAEGVFRSNRSNRSNALYIWH